MKRRIKKKYWGKKVFSTILSAVLVFTCILPVMSFAQGDEGDKGSSMEIEMPEGTGAVEAAEFTGENTVTEWDVNDRGGITLEIALDDGYSFKTDINLNDYRDQIIDGFVFQGLSYDKTSQQYHAIPYEEFVENVLNQYKSTGRYFPYLEEYEGAQVTVYDRFVGLDNPGAGSQFSGENAVKPSEELKAKYPGVKKGITEALKTDAQLSINEAGNLVIDCDSDYFDDFTNAVPVCNGGIPVALCDIVLSAELPAGIIQQNVSVTTKAGSYFTIQEMKYHAEIWEYVDESSSGEEGVISFNRNGESYYIRHVENDILTENDIRSGGNRGPNGTGDKLIRIVIDVRMGPTQWAADNKNYSTFYSNSFRTAVNATGYSGQSDTYMPADDEQWLKIENQMLEGGNTEEATKKYLLSNNKYVVNYSGNSRGDVDNPAPMWIMYEVPVVEDFDIDEDMNVYVNMIAGMTGGSGASAETGMPIVGMDGRAFFTIQNVDYIKEISALDQTESEKEVDYGTSLSSLNLPDTLKAVSDKDKAIEIKNITWNSQPSYDAKTPGSYVFTPVLPEGYVLEDGAVLPSITVKVKEKESSGGGSSGGSSGGGTPVQPDDDKDTVTNPDGSVTTTTKDEENGTVTEETEYTDGSVFTQVTSDDGTIRSEAAVSEKKIKDAEDKGEPAEISMPEIKAAENTGSAAEITIKLPCEETVVEIPVQDMTTGTVAVIVKEDGTEEIVKVSAVAEKGIILRVKNGDTIKIIENSRNFSDMQTHWAADAVDFASSRELFNGTDENTFSPDNSMTRGMLMTVLARLNGVDTEGGSIWYEKGLNWAIEQGISDGSNPDQEISREQLVTMLWRAAGSPQSMADMEKFSDEESVSSYASDAMKWAVSEGLITGTDNGQIIPKDDASRAQVATILMRYCEMLLK